jgi:tetratricopeptide (TPR) repeat protein
MLMEEIKSGKGHTLTYFHLVNSLMIMKEYKKAMEYVDIIFDKFKLDPLDPILPKLRTLRGLCCMNLYAQTKDGRYKLAAESDFLVSYGINKNVEAAVNIAESYMIDKKFDETIALLEPLMPNYMEVHSNNTNMPFDYKNIYLLMLRKLGDCYAIKKEWEKAEKYYREFITIKPMDLEVIDRICQVWRNYGKRGEANSMTAKAVNIWPTYYAGWGNLGAFELEMKRYITAELFLRKALGIKPDYLEGRHNLDMILRMKRK